MTYFIILIIAIIYIFYSLFMYFDIYITSDEDYCIIWFNTLDGDRTFIKINKIWKE